MSEALPVRTTPWTGEASPSLLSVSREREWLIARLSGLHRVASWAIVGGGLRRAHAVAWLQVREIDLRPPVDAIQYLRSRLHAAGVPDAVGLLTSRKLDAYTHVERSHSGFSARCVATVGLSNALRAGDPPGALARIGTINVLAHVSVPLTDEALLEALGLAAEARSLAVRESGVPSRLTGEEASGTGTDCIVVAAPDGPSPERYVGKHTVLGHLLGLAVLDAVAAGARDWKHERLAGPPERRP